MALALRQTHRRGNRQIKSEKKSDGSYVQPGVHGVESNPMNKKSNKHIGWVVLFPLVMLTLTGCWTPPNPNVQPAGQPGLIQGGIPVEILQDMVRVESVDLARRGIVLQHADGTIKSFNVTPAVQNLDQLKVGDVLTATVKAELSVYRLENGRRSDSADSSPMQNVPCNARVLKVDSSYRLLTLQFTNGQDLTLKVGRGIRLEKMATGDGVVMQSHEVCKITLRKP